MQVVSYSCEDCKHSTEEWVNSCGYYSKQVSRTVKGQKSAIGYEENYWETPIECPFHTERLIP